MEDNNCRTVPPNLYLEKYLEKELISINELI